MFNLQPWLEEAFEAEERVQQGLEEDKKIWSKENGKYLLNPDYFAAQLFSHVMHGKVLKLKNNQDNTIHQYGTINSKG